MCFGVFVTVHFDILVYHCVCHDKKNRRSIKYLHLSTRRDIEKLYDSKYMLRPVGCNMIHIHFGLSSSFGLRMPIVAVFRWHKCMYLIGELPGIYRVVLLSISYTSSYREQLSLVSYFVHFLTFPDHARGQTYLRSFLSLPPEIWVRSRGTCATECFLSCLVRARGAHQYILPVLVPLMYCKCWQNQSTQWPNVQWTLPCISLVDHTVILYWLYLPQFVYAALWLCIETVETSMYVKFLFLFSNCSWYEIQLGLKTIFSSFFSSPKPCTCIITHRPTPLFVLCYALEHVMRTLMA